MLRCPKVDSKESGEIVAQADIRTCIACGHCISLCKSKAIVHSEMNMRTSPSSKRRATSQPRHLSNSCGTGEVIDTSRIWRYRDPIWKRSSMRAAMPPPVETPNPNSGYWSSFWPFSRQASAGRSPCGRPGLLWSAGLRPPPGTGHGRLDRGRNYRADPRRPYLRHYRFLLPGMGLPGNGFFSGRFPDAQRPAKDQKIFRTASGDHLSRAKDSRPTKQILHR